MISNCQYVHDLINVVTYIVNFKSILQGKLDTAENSSSTKIMEDAMPILDGLLSRM